MEAQERIGTWCAWGVILLSWLAFFLVLALMFRATGCNRSSEAELRAWTSSLNHGNASHRLRQRVRPIGGTADRLRLDPVS